MARIFNEDELDFTGVSAPATGGASTTGGVVGAPEYQNVFSAQPADIPKVKKGRVFKPEDIEPYLPSPTNKDGLWDSLMRAPERLWRHAVVGGLGLNVEEEGGVPASLTGAFARGVAAGDFDRSRAKQEWERIGVPLEKAYQDALEKGLPTVKWEWLTAGSRRDGGQQKMSAELPIDKAGMQLNKYRSDRDAVYQGADVDAADFEEWRKKQMALYNQLPDSDNPVDYSAVVLGRLFGAAPSPENYIPFVGPAKMAGGPIMQGVKAGVANGILGNLITEPFLQGDAISRGYMENFDPQMALINVGVGGVLGGGFGGFGGIMRSRAAKRFKVQEDQVTQQMMEQELFDRYGLSRDSFSTPEKADQALQKIREVEIKQGDPDRIFNVTPEGNVFTPGRAVAPIGGSRELAPIPPSVFDALPTGGDRLPAPRIGGYLEPPSIKAPDEEAIAKSFVNRTRFHEPSPERQQQIQAEAEKQAKMKEQGFSLEQQVPDRSLNMGDPFEYEGHIYKLDQLYGPTMPIRGFDVDGIPVAFKDAADFTAKTGRKISKDAMSKAVSERPQQERYAFDDFGDYARKVGGIDYDEARGAGLFRDPREAFQYGPGVFRRGGKSIDRAVEHFEELGYFGQQDPNAPKQHDINSLVDIVRDDFDNRTGGNRRISPDQPDNALSKDQFQGTLEQILEEVDLPRAERERLHAYQKDLDAALEKGGYNNRAAAADGILDEFDATMKRVSEEAGYEVGEAYEGDISRTQAARDNTGEFDIPFETQPRAESVSADRGVGEIQPDTTRQAVGEAQNELAAQPQLKNFSNTKLVKTETVPYKGVNFKVREFTAKGVHSDHEYPAYQVEGPEVRGQKVVLEAAELHDKDGGSLIKDAYDEMRTRRLTDDSDEPGFNPLLERKIREYSKITDEARLEKYIEDMKGQVEHGNEMLKPVIDLAEARISKLQEERGEATYFGLGGGEFYKAGGFATLTDEYRPFFDFHEQASWVKANQKMSDRVGEYVKSGGQPDQKQLSLEAPEKPAAPKSVGDDLDDVRNRARIDAMLETNKERFFRRDYKTPEHKEIARRAWEDAEKNNPAYPIADVNRQVFEAGKKGRVSVEIESGRTPEGDYVADVAGTSHSNGGHSYTMATTEPRRRNAYNDLERFKTEEEAISRAKVKAAEKLKDMKQHATESDQAAINKLIDDISNEDLFGGAPGRVENRGDDLFGGPTKREEVDALSRRTEGPKKTKVPQKDSGPLFDEAAHKQSDLVDEAKKPGNPLKDFWQDERGSLDMGALGSFIKKYAVNTEQLGDFGAAIKVLFHGATGKKAWDGLMEKQRRYLGKVAYSVDSRMRLMAKRFNSPTMEKIADVFHSPAGREAGGGREYEGAVHHYSTRRLQRLYEIMEPFRKSAFGISGKVRNEANARIRAYLVGDAAGMRGMTDDERAVAKELRSMFDEWIEYRRESGEDIGRVDNYFPRIEDPDRVSTDPEGFVQSVVEVMRRSGYEGDLEAQARSYMRNIMAQHSGVKIDGRWDVEFDPFGIANNNAKARKFTQEADILLKKFYYDDVFEVAKAYLLSTAKRAEYNFRFGKPGRTASAERAAWIREHGDITQMEVYRRQVLKEMQESGVKMKDAEQEFVSMLQANLGTYGARVSRRARKNVSNIQAVTNVALMPFSALTSLSEGAMGIVRMGGHGVRALHKGLFYALREIKRDAEILGGKKLKDLNKSYLDLVAESYGIVSHALIDGILSSRVSMEGGSRFSEVLSASFFKGNLLHQLTAGQRKASLEAGMRFVYHLLHEVDADNVRVRRRAEFHLKELGIKTEDFNELRSRLDETDGLPSIEDINGDKGVWKTYNTAMMRLSKQTIMDPTRAERPQFANHPIGRIFYQLLSFSASFKKNMIDRVARMAVKSAKEKDLKYLLPAMMGLPIMMGIAYGTNEYIRPALRGETEASKKRRAEEGSWIKLFKAFDRAGFTATATVPINAFWGLRYRRSLATSFSGPTIGTYADSIEKYYNALTSDTYGAKRAAALAFYDTVIRPAENTAGNLFLKGPLKAGANVITSRGGENSLRENFADYIMDNFYSDLSPKGESSSPSSRRGTGRQKPRKRKGRR